MAKSDTTKSDTTKSDTTKSDTTKSDTTKPAPGPAAENLDGADLDPTAGLTEFEAAVVRVLLATEPGDVLAYGEVAAEAGYPGAARAVGNVLKRVDDLPWWRVVTASGRLIPHGPARQAELLAAEGVPTANGRLLLDR